MAVAKRTVDLLWQPPVPFKARSESSKAQDCDHAGHGCHGATSEMGFSSYTKCAWAKLLIAAMYGAMVDMKLATAQRTSHRISMHHRKLPSCIISANKPFQPKITWNNIKKRTRALIIHWPWLTGIHQGPFIWIARFGGLNMPAKIHSPLSKSARNLVETISKSLLGNSSTSTHRSGRTFWLKVMAEVEWKLKNKGSWGKCCGNGARR